MRFHTSSTALLMAASLVSALALGGCGDDAFSDAGANVEAGGSAGASAGSGGSGNAGEAGSGGTAGESNTAGNGGTAGESNTAGNGGTAGESNTAGSGGEGGESNTAGSGGTAGESNTAGSGGEGGESNTAGSGGEAGEGSSEGGSAGDAGSAGEGGEGGEAGSSSGEGGSGGTDSDCKPTQTCESAGAECGQIWDGCKSVECGGCASGQRCGSGASDNHCGCESATATFYVSADTVISEGISPITCELQTPNGDDKCSTIGLSAAGKMLLRFDDKTLLMLLSEKFVTSMTLQLPKPQTCNAGTSKAGGVFTAFAMRSDWDESQATWCYRNIGKKAAWAANGAAKAGVDHGAALAALSFDVSDPSPPRNFELDMGVFYNAPLSSSGGVSFMVAQSGRPMAAQMREGGEQGAALEVTYCK